MEWERKRTWAEISLSNLEHNYRALRALLPRSCRFLGVVKANAYGHGALTVGRKLEQLGCEMLAVACLDEGIALREAGIRTQIHAEQKKFKQKLSYADKLHIPYAVLLGEDDIAQGACSVKDLRTGAQVTLPPDQAVAHIRVGLDKLNQGTPILDRES